VPRSDPERPLPVGRVDIKPPPPPSGTRPEGVSDLHGRPRAQSKAVRQRLGHDPREATGQSREGGFRLHPSREDPASQEAAHIMSQAHRSNAWPKEWARRTRTERTAATPSRPGARRGTRREEGLPHRQRGVGFDRQVGAAWLVGTNPAKSPMGRAAKRGDKKRAPPHRRHRERGRDKPRLPAGRGARGAAGSMGDDPQRWAPAPRKAIDQGHEPQRIIKGRANQRGTRGTGTTGHEERRDAYGQERDSTPKALKGNPRPRRTARGRSRSRRHESDHNQEGEGAEPQGGEVPRPSRGA
jgi:hypothetical protein